MSSKVMNAGDFKPLDTWGSPVEVERRRRIQLSVYTYAYEVLDAPLVDDHAWDSLAQRVNKRQGTGHPLLDEFFYVHFSPMTGMWIHQHPELDGIKAVHDRYRRNVLEHFSPRGIR